MTLQKLVRTASFALLFYLVFSPIPAFAASLDVLDRQRQTRPEPKAQPPLRVQEEAGQPVYDQSLRFTLASLRIEGATVFSEEELLAPYVSLYGTEVSFDAVNKIAAELTKKYRDKGYLLSRVALPAQELEPLKAQVRLVAVEGYIASIEYEGEEKFVERFRSYFSGAEKRLTSQRPLRHGDFEREMLLLQDLAGVKASSRFKEGSGQGASILVLTVANKILDAVMGYGNTGSRSAGPHMFNASLGISTLPVIGAKTTVSYNQAANPQEYLSIQIAQSYQFSNGLLLNGSYAHSKSPEADTEFARTFDQKTKSDTFSLGLSYPFIRSRDMNLSAGLSFESRDSTDDVLSERFSKDRLRSGTVNINFDIADEWGGVTQLLPSFTRGFNVLNATDMDKGASNPRAPAEYSRFNAYLSRNQQLFSGFSLFTAASVQLADSRLSSYNQFSLGGSQFGRGYEPGVIQNDNGVAVTIEPRWTYWLTDKTAIQPYVFYDWGKAWATKRIADAPNHESLSSIGVGLRLWGHAGESYLPDFNVGVFLAKDLERVRGKNDHTHCGVQVTLTF